MLQKILEYKPGAAFYMIGGLVLFIAMALFTQYKMKGRVDLAQLIDREADRKPFWDRNTSLEYVDSYPNTSLVMVRDRQTGRTGMLDLAGRRWRRHLFQNQQAGYRGQRSLYVCCQLYSKSQGQPGGGVLPQVIH